MKEFLGLFVPEFWSGLKESRGPLLFYFGNLKESRTTLVPGFWSSSRQCQKPLGFYFRCGLKESRAPFYLIFDVVWKNLGDPFLFCFWSPSRESWEFLVMFFKLFARISGTLGFYFWSSLKVSRRLHLFWFLNSWKESQTPYFAWFSK